jgi:2-iminobutanoate/2-iminopropanoate deaminase
VVDRDRPAVVHREAVNPPEMYAPTWQFSQALKVTGGTFLFVSGVMGYRPDGVMPTGIVAQAEGAFTNLRTVLRAAGGDLDDIVKVTVFVGEDYATHRDELREVRALFFTGTPPASTLVQVAGFANPEYLIEIEATAVLAQ